MPKKITTKKSPVAKGMRFEEAMKHLRKHAMIRRRAWLNDDSYIVRAGETVVLYFHRGIAGMPQQWRPWPSDVLATDWVVMK